MAKKRSAGGKLSRTEVVTVRLDSKLKLALDLAARKQRRTMSSFIEYAIEQATKKVPILDKDERDPRDEFPWDAYITSQKIWDPEEADTFCNFAFALHNLLNHEERMRWKLIKEHDYFWDGEEVRGKKRIIRDKNTLLIKRVREEWDTLTQIIDGEDIPIPSKSQNNFTNKR